MNENGYINREPRIDNRFATRKAIALLYRVFEAFSVSILKTNYTVTKVDSISGDLKVIDLSDNQHPFEFEFRCQLSVTVDIRGLIYRGKMSFSIRDVMEEWEPEISVMFEDERYAPPCGIIYSQVEGALKGVKSKRMIGTKLLEFTEAFLHSMKPQIKIQDIFTPDNA